MDLFKQGMKGPTRPAPAVPGLTMNSYTSVTNWDNDPFGADVFEPLPHAQKKKPPPRPPPPKIFLQQPDVPTKPSHFIRKPTVLSSLLSRKSKTVSSQNHNQNTLPAFTSDADTNQIFPKCEPKNVQTGALIDLSSPPSSPTFTTRSSSDGLSVDSFGSDGTTSTNHQNNQNGNSSQAESGFEDDFDLFLNTRKSKQNTLNDFTEIDPFSPQIVIKPPIIKKPVLSKDLFDSPINQIQVPLLKGPTIIRAKPVRPKPPDNSVLLKSTFNSGFSVTSMNVNTTIPIQKVNSFADNFDSNQLGWDEDESPERESSPPMPTIPPPPPPAVTDDYDSIPWNGDDLDYNETLSKSDDYEEQPYAIALFDYSTDHPDDLCFSVNAKIKLIRRVDDEWLFGSLKNGVQGTFPSNYVDIKVPLPNEPRPVTSSLGLAVALYSFEPNQPGDLGFNAGDTITISYKLNDEWYFGECNGRKGQFPVNYVQMG